MTSLPSEANGQGSLLGVLWDSVEPQSFHEILSLWDDSKVSKSPMIGGWTSWKYRKAIKRLLNMFPTSLKYSTNWEKECS